jgi:hypothetical protein
MNIDIYAAKYNSARTWAAELGDEWSILGEEDVDHATASYIVYRAEREPADTGVRIDVIIQPDGREAILVWCDDEDTLAANREHAVRLYDELIHRP